MWNTGGAYSMSQGMAVSGMPTAYDLSTVMGSGSAVSHNNLIPLGRILRTDGLTDKHRQCD
uniref:Uncharacterized protein n=1 Tax=Hucho hucho TaxID=62062 RepID=A0A4W5LY48_9TELE